MESYEYAGIPVDKLAGYFIADMVYHFADKNFIGKIKMFARLLLFIPKLSRLSTHQEALFGWSIKRPDYEKLSKAYKKKLAWDFDDICLSSVEKGWKINFDIRAFSFALKHVAQLKNLRRSEKIAILLSVYVATSFYNFLDTNFKINDLKKYLSFNSSFAYESVFTLFLRNNNIETFSMQHGMYFEFKNEIPFDVINYENVSAKNLLVWGGFSGNQIKKYLHPFTEPVIFGNPNYQEIEFFNNGFDQNEKRILVCLPRTNYIQESLALLNILADDNFTEYNFILRPHPSLNKVKLKNATEKIKNITFSQKKNISDEFEDKYLAMIGFNSTVLFESLLHNLPILQFRSGNDEFYDVGFLEFFSKNELQIIFKTLSIDGYENKILDLESYFGLSL